MHILIDGKPVTLAPWQMEKVHQEQTRRELEETASALLEAYLNNSGCPDGPVLSPSAIYAPWHIDYLSDRISARFRRTRRNTVTDAATWRKAIRLELAAWQKQLSGLPEVLPCGPWLLRPVNSLLQLLWRCQYNRDSVDFCLDESISRQPQMLYHVSFTDSDGLLYLHLTSRHSQLMHLLDDGTERTYPYEDLAQAVKELLSEDLRHMGRKLPKYLWVYE